MSNLSNLSDLYDLYYRDGQSILEVVNMCDLKKVEGVWTCRDGFPCCTHCSHLGSEGCTIQSIGCKLSLCDLYKSPRSFPFNKSAEGLFAAHMLTYVRRLAKEDHLPLTYWMTKEESLSKGPNYYQFLGTV